MSEVETGPIAEQSEAIITCENIVVGYGSDIVLKNVSLRFPGGKYILLMGPNGAGKTTLIKAILGLISLRSGSIITPFSVKPPGYVPQQKSIDPLFPVNVRQIVEMGLYSELGWWKRKCSKCRQVIDETLERFNLLEHDRKLFSELSAGMRQKALIARAFVNGCDVFILDEPTSELDQQTECEVSEHLHRLVKEQNKTVIVVHHGLGFTVDHSDLICMVNHGKATMLKPHESISVRQLADAARKGVIAGECVV